MKNELGRVLSLVEAFKTSGDTRAHFARKRRLHPSALSRILRVAELPSELLGELAALPSLSRTHLEVIATAPAERRAAVVEAVRSGRSTYRIRERRETTALALDATPATGTTTTSATDALPGTSASATADSAAPPCPAPVPPAPASAPPAPAPPAPTLAGPLAEVARAFGATPEEATAFAAELLHVLWRSGRDRVEESFRAFRAARLRA